jgi:D-alanyl-D-alanine carboxypeptidase (penicillin-binding protein 5/6)
MTHRRLRNALYILAAAGLAAVLVSPPVSAIETTAREAFLIDATTGRVLLDKNSDVSMPPASMSKIMTSFMVLERL